LRSPLRFQFAITIPLLHDTIPPFALKGFADIMKKNKEAKDKKAASASSGGGGADGDQMDRMEAKLDKIMAHLGI
jgi:hypothetical protein